MAAKGSSYFVLFADISPRPARLLSVRGVKVMENATDQMREDS
jgi:hypothetical protein